MAQRGRKGQPINGVLLLDKPTGITSNKALQICRYIIDAQKGGHTGALDPLATGLLPLCFGQATKISSYLLGSDKSYQVKATLGKTTDTGDADGQVTATQDVNISLSQLKDAARKFVGEYAQTPPMYSAIKVQGQPLYKLARQGITVERKARNVSAYAINSIQLQDDQFTFDLDCSSGFYVRSLVEDIGNILKCGAHVTQLRRTKIGSLKIDTGITIDHFKNLPDQPARLNKLLPADTLISYMPKLVLDLQQETAIKYGQLVYLDKPAFNQEESLFRLYNQDQLFLGLGTQNTDGELKAKRLFTP